MAFRSKKKVVVVNTWLSRRNAIKRTGVNTYTISMSYSGNETPINLNAGPFKSKSEASQHVEDLKMFVDMTDSKLGTCRITKSGNEDLQ
jgi:hypothetical protein